MPSKLQRAIGAVKDQTSIGLAKVSYNTTPVLEVAVLKATTHDDDPIDEKIIHEILLLVLSNKFHAAACARAIGKRIGRTRNWMVALKSLKLVLRIFQDGDPYFPREVLHAMKRGAKILNLSSFRDESSSSSPWDYTSFVRTFALYLDERLECFLTGKLQRRRYTNGTKECPAATTYQRSNTRCRRPNEPTLDMKPAMLLDRITYWQRLLDRAIATRPTGAARINRLVQTCLYAIVQESFDLYKDISEGLSLILDNFFHLQFQNCVNAFHACAKAAKQFKELNNFYSLCKSIGVGRSSEYPNVQTISEDLIEALQDFLNDQSSFSSNAKPAMQQHSEINKRRRLERERQTSQCASLEDLIKATATKASAIPAISIDLEAYVQPQRDEAFMISETSSVRSLPVDLISLWDGSDLDERDQQQQQLHGSSPSDNWELVLAETLSTSSPSLSLSQSPLTMTSDYRSTPAALSDNWELILFEPSPPQPQPQPLPQNNYYNPFLQDPMEVQVPAISMPTFHATPPFSMQFSNQTFAAQYGNDPFSAPLNWTVDEQNLMREQQQWLANQNKIIAKYM